MSSTIVIDILHSSSLLLLSLLFYAFVANYEVFFIPFFLSVFFFLADGLGGPWEGLREVCVWTLHTSPFVVEVCLEMKCWSRIICVVWNVQNEALHQDQATGRKKEKKTSKVLTPLRKSMLVSNLEDGGDTCGLCLLICPAEVIIISHP